MDPETGTKGGGSGLSSSSQAFVLSLMDRLNGRASANTLKCHTSSTRPWPGFVLENERFHYSGIMRSTASRAQINLREEVGGLKARFNNRAVKSDTHRCLSLNLECKR